MARRPGGFVSALILTTPVMCTNSKIRTRSSAGRVRTRDWLGVVGAGTVLAMLAICFGMAD